ncbi:MAG: hypothetical protein SF162_17105 [bacterium]|nr:hypothetical protein [bacterium]
MTDSMHRCRVITFWTVENGLNMADAAARYPGAWSDVSGQPDTAIAAPDQVMFEGLVSADVLAALTADPLVTLLPIEETGS